MLLLFSVTIFETEKVKDSRKGTYKKNSDANTLKAKDCPYFILLKFKLYPVLPSVFQGGIQDTAPIFPLENNLGKQ